MHAMERVHLIRESSRAGRARDSQNRAWLLEPETFHREFDDLYAETSTSEGLVRMRWLATQIWRSTDLSIHRYVDLLHTSSPDDWEGDFNDAQLADWYRVLMAEHLVSVPAVSDPRTLREGLPNLGFTPAEARRLAYGHALKSLVEAYGSEPAATEIAPQLLLDSRGWLGIDDVEMGLERLRALDPHLFRDAQPMVPLVEELYALLAAARDHPDRVLLLLAD
jgi:hypothetical protein